MEICEHPFFSEGIEEIALLGQVLWKEIEGELRANGVSPCAKRYNAAAKGQFCPWPNQPYTEKGRRIESTTALPFDEAYGQLLAAVKSLPNIRALSFVDGAQLPGWNQTSKDSIERHARTCSLRPKTATQQLRRSDADVVLNLASTIKRLTSIHVDTTLPFAGTMARELQTICGGLHSSPASHRLSHVENLTSLDLVLSFGKGDSEHALERGLIACAAPALQHLRLALVPQYARAQSAVVFEDLTLLSLSGILDFGGDGTTSRELGCYFKRLESLTLEYRDRPIPTKCKNEHRRVRPSCQILNLNALLESVRQTIRRVTINNIIFPPKEYGLIGNPKDTNLSIHHGMTAGMGTAYPNLEHFEWRVNRYEHDPRCRSIGRRENHRDCEKYLCGWYLPQCTLEHYETTAETLGAEFTMVDERVGAEFGDWDFGGAIMRARQAASASASSAGEIARLMGRSCTM